MHIPLLRQTVAKCRVLNKYRNRKQWLRDLQREEGGINELALKIETDPNYLSAILGKSAKRNVGDELARRTERVFGLPPGVLDLPSAATQRLIIESEGLDEATIGEVIEFMRFKKTNKN